MLILGEKYNLFKKDLDYLKFNNKKIHKVNIIEKDFDSLKLKVLEYLDKNISNIVVLNFNEDISIKLVIYLKKLNYSHIEFYTYSEFLSKFFNRCHLEYYNDNFTLYEQTQSNLFNRFLKRAFDILFSIFAIILLIPVYILIFLLIKIKSPGAPAVFAHKRIGKDGKFIKVYKFRTMVPNADNILKDWLNNHPNIKEEFEKDFKLKDDPRIIPGIGEALRKLSIDELPQFFNAFLGDLSIVGPRPIVEEELPKYGKNVIKLYSVKPGITGLWQVSGRNNITYEERVALDMKYIDTQSLLKDIQIIFKTVFVILFKNDTY